MVRSLPKCEFECDGNVYKVELLILMYHNLKFTISSLRSHPRADWRKVIVGSCIKVNLNVMENKPIKHHHKRKAFQDGSRILSGLAEDFKWCSW